MDSEENGSGDSGADSEAREPAEVLTRTVQEDVLESTVVRLPRRRSAMSRWRRTLPIGPSTTLLPQSEKKWTRGDGYPKFVILTSPTCGASSRNRHLVAQ